MQREDVIELIDHFRFRNQAHKGPGKWTDNRIADTAAHDRDGSHDQRKSQHSAPSSATKRAILAELEFEIIRRGHIRFPSSVDQYDFRPSRPSAGCRGERFFLLLH